MSVTGLRAERTEDVMLEIEKSKTSDVTMRLIDRRREQLKELASVEKRLQMPQNSGPIVLKPLPPPSYESPSKTAAVSEAARVHPKYAGDFRWP